MRETELFGHEEFICFWRLGAGDKYIIETHDADFFTKENGYSESDIEILANTLISESADLSRPGQEHYVMRIC